jgi:hypothetical protein
MVNPTQALSWIRQMHALVDGIAAETASPHGDRLACKRGCSGCCVDDLTVFDVEAERIRQEHSELLANSAPHPLGACAFLDDEGACRIYDSRPYVCRTQGLPLRWLVQAPPEGGGTENGTEEAGITECRDVCPVHADAIGPLGDIPADACWTLGPFEDRLAAVQEATTGSQGRIQLRALFATAARTAG